MPQRQMPFDHVGEKLNEAAFFVHAMDILHKQHVDHILVAHRPAFDGQGRTIARAFQYNFSAFLSAHRATRYFIIRISGRLPETSGWRKRIDNDPIMEAFRHLRDVDIHDETLNMSARLSITKNDDGTDSLGTSGLMLHRDTLSANRRLQRVPEVIDLWSARPILRISQDGLKALTDIVHEGQQLGYLRPQTVTF
jgi:hypothetical protein